MENIRILHIADMHQRHQGRLYYSTGKKINNGFIKNDFNVLQRTDEDIKRGQMYAQQRERKELEKSISNLDDFLEQLDIKVKMKNSNEFLIPRISQLTLKTNQFNLTTRRYQEEEIRNFTNDRKSNYH